MRTSAETGAEGIRVYGKDVGLLHTTETMLRGKLIAAQDANASYRAAMTALPRIVAPLHRIDEQVGKFIALTRDVLKPKLGSHYSKYWLDVGFTEPTLRVPRRREVRLSRLKSLELYFQANPDAEVAVLGLTAADASALHRALLDAMCAVNAARVAQRQRKVEKLAAVEELRLAMQRLYRELKVLLPRNDSRWMEFGFNVPADLSVPAAPEAVEAKPVGAATVTVECERPVGATRFRIFQKVEGIDANFVHIETSRELKVCLGGYAPGARVKFYVVAANAAGQSPPSAIVECVVV